MRQTIYCWRCQKEMPMLDEKGHRKLFKIYKFCKGEAYDYKFKYSIADFNENLIQVFYWPLFEEFKKLTGFETKDPEAIFHHLPEHYGSPCENCGKPYRTVDAAFCAECNHSRQT